MVLGHINLASPFRQACSHNLVSCEQLLASENPLQAVAFNRDSCWNTHKNMTKTKTPIFGVSSWTTLGERSTKLSTNCSWNLIENMFIRSLGHGHYHQDFPNTLQVNLKLEHSKFQTLSALKHILSLFQSFQWIYTYTPSTFFWVQKGRRKKYYPMHQYVPGKVKIIKALWKPTE